MNVDGIEPLAEGIEEEEDGEVEENGGTISQASHLEFGEAIKEIGAHSATCEMRHLAVNIAGIRGSIFV